MDPANPWNSLEVFKVAASLLIPATIAYAGFVIQRQLATQTRVVERRLDVYGRIGEGLNRIHCFVEDIGDFRSDTPDTIVGYKRNSDSAMFAWQAIWPEDTFASYVAFMDTAFAHYTGGTGRSARIRTTAFEKRAGVPGWNSDWESTLTGERDAGHRDAYQKLIKLILRDIVTPGRSGTMP